MINQIKTYIYRKWVQAEKFSRIKSELKEGEILVQWDYNESCKSIEQDEIQSAYFGHSCFSTFTARGYYKVEDKLFKYCITITSETSDYSRIAFTCFNRVIQNTQDEINARVTKVYACIDDMAAPFRSRSVFRLLSTFDPSIDLERNEMEVEKYYSHWN